MGKALVHAIGDGTIVVQRREDFLDGVQDVFEAADVEEGFLLAGERGIRQIFGRGRRAYSKRSLRTALGDQSGVMHGDFFFELFRERGIDHPLADLGTRLQQGIHIVHIQR